MLDDSLSSDIWSCVDRAIIPTPVAVKGETLLKDAIAQMHQAKSSYILSTDQQRPVGIFTERDLVRLLASGQSIVGMTLATVMTQELFTLAAEDVKDAFEILHLMKKKRIRHLPIVDVSGNLTGIVTQSSLLKSLDPNEIQQVAERLQQKVEQLRSENQTLMEDCTCELGNQLRLSQQLEQSHSRLTATNVTLTTTLQDLQIAKQDLQQANLDLENQVEMRTADLRQVEHCWRTLLENVPLAVVSINDDGKVNYVNPFLLELTGYTAVEVLGEDWFEQFVPLSEQPKLTQYFQQLLTQPDAPIRYQNTILTQTGEQRTFFWHNTLLRDNNGTIIGSMSIGEDITERLVIDRMKSEFITLVGHELRTPLTSIYGGLKLLTQGLVVSESEEGQQLLRTAAKSSQRLIQLVENILDFECLESGKSPLQKQPINTKTLTHQAIKTVQPIAKQAGITLEVHAPDFDFVADNHRIHQVLTHLLDNAIKFSPAGTTVWLTVEKPLARKTNQTKPIVRFSIRDQGSGIPLEKLDTIFDRFIQADSSDTRSQGGTGLGLAICRKIIEQHGGKIWVESIPGEGNCFYFTLPGS